MGNRKYLASSLRLIADKLKDQKQPLDALILEMASNRLDELEDVLKDYIKEDRMATPNDLMKTQGVKAGEIFIVASGTGGRSLVAEEMKKRDEERRKALDACNCLECFQREMQIDRNLAINWNRIISDVESEV